MTLGELLHNISPNEWTQWKLIKIELVENYSGNIHEIQCNRSFNFNDYDEMLLNGELKNFYHYNVVKWFEDVNCYYVYGYECKTIQQHDKHILFHDAELEEQLSDLCIYFNKN